MARVNKDHTVLPATHTFIHKWNNHTCLYSPSADHRRTLAGLYILISRPAESRRLSWPGCLGETLRWFVRRRRSPIPLPVLILTGPDVE